MRPLATASYPVAPCSQIKQRRTVNFSLHTQRWAEAATAACLDRDHSISSHSDCKENRGMYTTLKLENEYNISEHLNIQGVSHEHQS